MPATKVTYAEKLKNPKWQKRRLEILQRDDFRCRFCQDSESTLHVHHLSYQGNPWETPSEHLITLCEDCHEDETHNRKEYENTLLKTLKEKGYPGGFVIDLAAGIYYMQKFYDAGVMGNVINWLLKNADLMGAITNMYFDSLNFKRNKETAEDNTPL